MTGYLQRLLDRSAADAGMAEAGIAEAGGEAVLHAAGIAPVTSPLVEADQRFGMAGFDADMLTAMLFDIPSAEEPGWTIPENPFGQTRQATPPPPAPGRDAPGRGAEPAPVPPPPFALSDFLAPAITPDEQSREPAPQQTEQAVTAKPASAPQAPESIIERIVEHTEIIERDIAEPRYRFLREQETGERAEPSPQPREISVERLETIETFRETIIKDPALTPDDPAQELPLRDPAVTRAEPVHRPAAPEPAVLAEEAVPLEFPAAQERVAPTAEKRDEPRRRRGDNEATPEAPGLAPFTSAAAASVIGPLPLRPSSLTLRGWRRR